MMILKAIILTSIAAATTLPGTPSVSDASSEPDSGSGTTGTTLDVNESSESGDENNVAPWYNCIPQRLRKPAAAGATLLCCGVVFIILYQFDMVCPKEWGLESLERYGILTKWWRTGPRNRGPQLLQNARRCGDCGFTTERQDEKDQFTCFDLPTEMLTECEQRVCETLDAHKPPPTERSSKTGEWYYLNGSAESYAKPNENLSKLSEISYKVEGLAICDDPKETKYDDDNTCYSEHDAKEIRQNVQKSLDEFGEEVGKTFVPVEDGEAEKLKIEFGGLNKDTPYGCGFAPDNAFSHPKKHREKIAAGMPEELWLNHATVIEDPERGSDYCGANLKGPYRSDMPRFLKHEMMHVFGLPHTYFKNNFDKHRDLVSAGLRTQDEMDGQRGNDQFSPNDLNRLTGVTTLLTEEKASERIQEFFENNPDATCDDLEGTVGFSTLYDEGETWSDVCHREKWNDSP